MVARRVFILGPLAAAGAGMAAAQQQGVQLQGVQLQGVQGEQPPSTVPPPRRWISASCSEVPGVAHAFGREETLAALRRAQAGVVISRGAALAPADVPKGYSRRLSHYEVVPLLAPADAPKSNLALGDLRRLVEGARTPESLGIGGSNLVIRNRTELAFRSLSQQLSALGLSDPKREGNNRVVEAGSYEDAARQAYQARGLIMGFREPAQVRNQFKVLSIEGRTPTARDYPMAVPVYVYERDSDSAKKAVQDFQVRLQSRGLMDQ